MSGDAVGFAWDPRPGAPLGPPEQRPHLQWAGIALGAVLLLVVGFSAGRFSAPATVETREVERVVFKDLVVEDITRGYTFAQTVTKTVWRNVETRPDGTTVDKSIEHHGAATATSGTETGKRTEDHQGQRDTEKVTTTTALPDWRIGLQVGASMKPPALPITGPLVIGASVERRILGGVSAGLWANTVGAGGASVSIEF
ncbi:MAG: hypothetical protein Q8K32_31295 [Archangium sp.]|nr:hypothetical protein [Archangium sp.]